MTLINGRIVVREECEDIAAAVDAARESGEIFVALTDPDGKTAWVAWRQIAVMTPATRNGLAADREAAKREAA